MWGESALAFCLATRFAGRMDCTATVKAVRGMTTKWPGTMAILIEDKANGSAVVQMLAHEIPRIFPVNPSGGKVARPRRSAR